MSVGRGGGITSPSRAQGPSLLMESSGQEGNVLDTELQSHLGTKNWCHEQDQHEWVRREGSGVQAAVSLPELSGESQIGLHTLSPFPGVTSRLLSSLSPCLLLVWPSNTDVACFPLRL